MARRWSSPAGGISDIDLAGSGVTATIIDGKAIAAEVREEVAERVQKLAARGVTPRFVDLLIGDETAGRRVVVVGRSTLVGRPLSILLSSKGPGLNATVTLCHTGTKDLTVETLRAEILVVASGRALSITGDMVAPGAVVIDVGI